MAEIWLCMRHNVMATAPHVPLPERYWVACRYLNQEADKLMPNRHHREVALRLNNYSMKLGVFPASEWGRFLSFDSSLVYILVVEDAD